MPSPNKKLIYVLLAPLAPALIPIALGLLWTTASLVAQGESSNNDANVEDQELLLVQNKTPQIVTDTETESDTFIPKKKNVSVGTISAIPKATPSPNVTINLINRLVQRGVLTQTDADELIKQAENDAAKARELAAKEQARAISSEPAPPPFPFSEPSPLPDTMSSNVVAQPAPPPVPAQGPVSDSDDAVSVSYVPDVVKEQLREEIKEEVMEQARDENWANPRIFPTWVLAFHPFADIRLRYEGAFPSVSEDDPRQLGSTFQFTNFNAINTSAPFDVTNGVNFPPELNVDQDRERARIRARFGAEMDLDEGFTLGIRVATGETNTPTSTNQTLGVANNGQGGNYSKYAIWLDRAFVKYELGGKPTEDFVVEAGRFDNPYFTVSELMWDVDLGWDGLALSGKKNIADGVTPFATAGIFPVFNTDFNFSSNQPDKFGSEDKWLYGGQAGVSLRLTKDFSTKIAGGFFDFYNIEGKLSDPCIVLSSADQCDTDDSRPSFAQHGNTYFPIRHIERTVDNNNGLSKQFQYFGLATPFRVATFTGNLDFARFDPVHLTAFGEWLDNVAFDYEDISRVALNNIGPNRPAPSPGGTPRPGLFAGGNTGWISGLKAGHAALEKRWDWTVGADYRWIESDATVDAFNDSDFGGGGTNLKGYEIFGGLAVSKNVSFYLRWMSADSIAGPTYRNDIVQFDFNAKF